MKLEVKENGKRVICLQIPNFFIKSKLFAKMLLKKKGGTQKEIAEMQKFFKSIYQDLKKQLKTLGHFTFLDVESGGDRVIISF